MAITLRTVKGSALTHLELDTNFTDIDANTGTTYNTLRIYADSNAYNTYDTLTANLYNTFAYLNANSAQAGAGTLANDYNTYLFATSNDYNTYSTLSGLVNTVQSNLTTDIASIDANVYNTYLTVESNIYDTYVTVSGLVDTVQDNVTAALSPTLALNRFDYIANANQTVFNGPDINSQTMFFDTATTQVYMNGLLLRSSNDYTLTASSNTVTLTLGVAVDTEITVTSLSIS